MQVSQNEENSMVVSSVRETSGGEEIRRKWTRFRYFGVRIAHRWSRASDLPHDSFFSSDESFHSHARTAALTRVRIIDPPAARENIQCSVTSIRTYYAVEEIILSRKSNGNRVRGRARFVLPLFLFPENRDEPTRPIAISYAIEHSQLMYANITFATNSHKYLLIENILHAYMYFSLKLQFMLLIIKIIFETRIAEHFNFAATHITFFYYIKNNKFSNYFFPQ